jgi:3-methyladenine DNA glycosylase Mpg
MIKAWRVCLKRESGWKREMVVETEGYYFTQGGAADAMRAVIDKRMVMEAWVEHYEKWRWRRVIA